LLTAPPYRFVRPLAIAIPLLGIGLLLTLRPEIDLWVARQFYLPAIDGFPFAWQQPFFTAEGQAEIDRWVAHLFDFGFFSLNITNYRMDDFRAALSIPAYVLAAACGLSLLWCSIKGRYLFGLDRPAILYLISNALLGVLLITNLFLKEIWGRARPLHLAELSHWEKDFSPAWILSDQCESNCSFISGEASLGFLFLAVAFLLPPGWRRGTGMVCAIAYGSLLSAVRILQGGHFLSDVYFSFLLMLGLAWLLHGPLVRRDITATWFRSFRKG
jgi:lipid A 4'-phosphatase